MAVSLGTLQFIEIPTDTREALTMAWVTDPNAQPTAPPLATLASADAAVSAQLWMGIDERFLYIRGLVNDETHVNTGVADSIWNGDALQVAIDPGGEGASTLLNADDPLPRGAMYATFARTDDGPRAWTHLRGAPDEPGPLETPSRITRDDKARQTYYDLRLPWDTLRTSPEQTSIIGLAIQVNDSQPGKTAQTRLFWGENPAGSFQANKFIRLRFPSAPHPVSSCVVKRVELWHAADHGAIGALAHGTGNLVVRASYAAEAMQWLVAAPAAGAQKRWEVRVTPNAPPAAGDIFVVRLEDESGRLLQVCSAALTLEEANVQRGLSVLRDRGWKSNDALLRRHFASVTALMDQAWHKALIFSDVDLQRPRSVLEALHKLENGLKDDDASIEAVRSGRQRILLTFLSRSDDSLQPYAMRLPRHPRPGPAPVIVFLHGRGDPQLTHFIANLNESATEPFDDAFILSPWARGNMYYTGVAEADVLDALAHARTIFDIDTNRVYLAGFSMGGCGAWALAVHHPDLWAAVSINSGGPWTTPLGVGLGGNVQSLPIYMYHGDADNDVPIRESYKMRNELVRSGNTPRFVVAKGVGHVFSHTHFEEVAQWLLSHTRKRPQRFSYVSADFAQRGRDGIRMAPDSDTVPFPRFSCVIEGSVVRLDSTGTSGLSLELGQEGLNLSGEVSVFWNGTRRYVGPPRRLLLGAGPGPR